MFSAFPFLTLCFITILDSKVASTKDNGSSWDFPWLLPYRTGSPEILNILTNKTLSPGKGVSFRCRVVGNPRPRIKWKKDGVIITQSLRVKIKQFDWGSRLRIRNIRPADEGVYKCIAKSQGGQKVSASAYVRVKGNRRHKQRRCQRYTGRFCRARLVYLPSGKQQHQIDRRLAKIVKMVRTPRCQKQLIVFHCKLNYPSCSPRGNDKPRTVCREDCHKLEKKFCRRDVRMLGSLWHQSVACSKLPWTNCQRIFERGSNHKHATNKTTVRQGKNDTSHSRNSCQKYQGDVCQSHMATGGMVATSGQQTQTETERGLKRVLLLLQNYTSSKCKQYLHKALCYHMFPPCSTGPHPAPRQMCRLQCEVLQGRICSKEYRLARLLNPDSNLLPWCSDLPTSNKNNGNSCLSLAIDVNENDDFSGWEKCSTFLKRNQKKKFAFTVMSRWKGSWCGKENPSTLSAKIPRNVQNLFPRSNFSSARITVSKKQHQTTYCVESAIRLKKLVVSWDHYHRTSRLPHLRIPLTSTQIPGVQVILNNMSSKLHSVLVPLGSAVSYRVHEKVLLENVTFYYRYQSTRGSFLATGLYRLCETVFKVSVEALDNGAVQISGNATTPLDVNMIERVFGLVTPISKLIEGAIRRSELLIMRIMFPSIQIYLDKGITVKFAGQSYLTSYGHPTFLEFYVGKRRQEDVLVASLTSQSLTFEKVVQIFTGFEIPSLDWTKGTSSQSRVGALLSTLDLDSAAEKFRITGRPLSTAFAGSIPAGLTFMFQTSVPGSCNGVRMCEIVKAAFGQDSLFTLKATTKYDQVLIDVIAENLSHDALVAYKSIHLSMKVVNGNMSYLDILPSITFDISGFLHLTDRHGKQENKLHFTGMFEYSGIWAKLLGEFDVNQYWRQAFNIPYLAFKNLRASFILPTDGINPPPDHSISTKADFEFGVGCSSTNNSTNKDGCITGQVFLGLSQDIREHYFYGSVGPVSLLQFLRACGLDVHLPRIVASTGFPYGLKISIARTIHDVGLEGGPLIRPGLIMSGTINMFGIETDASISLLPSEFSIDAELEGTGMELLDEASENLPHHDHDYKPVVYMKTRLNPDAFVKVHIDAYSRIFGVFDEVRVLISRQVTQIKMVAEIHKSIQAHVYLMWNNSKRVNTTHLKAKIIFKNQLSKLTRLASKHVITMLEAEMSQLKTAEKELRRKSKECAKAAKSSCLRCLGNSKCLAKLSQCTAQHRSILHSVCQRMVLAGCKPTNDTCQSVCTELASCLNDSCLSYHNSAATLQKLQYSLQWVRQTRLLMAGSLFNIHSISFRAQVSPNDIVNTVVDTTFDVTIFGQRSLLTGLKLHLDSFSKLTAEIAKQAFTWYDKRHRLHSN